MGLKVKKRRATPPNAHQMQTFYDPARDGVTHSLLSTFLDCREKAKLYLQGWSGAYTGFHLVMGTMIHYILRCAYTQRRLGQLKKYPNAEWVRQTIDNAYELWKRENPKPHEKAQAIIEEVMMKAQAIMPHYFYYWRDDFTDRRWIEVEEKFNLKWTVPVTRVQTAANLRKGIVRTDIQPEMATTFLRGRIDGAFTLPNSNKKAFRLAPRLLETKTRNTVTEEDLVDTMPHNRQTNLYLSALRKKTGKEPRSVTMNIIRKPLLRQKQTESWAGFAKRIEADARARMDHYFLRMEMTVDPQDINRSEEELNDLISDFLLWWHGRSGHYKNSNSCHPIGMGPCAYLRFCAYGDTHGLVKRPVVFRELEGE